MLDICTQMQMPTNVSALPAGIVMADKPLSRRHYVLTDKDNSAPVSEIITRHIREEREDMQPDETLVVIMSESHPRSDHKGLITSVIVDAALYRNEEPDDATRKFLYAHEHPYNELESSAIDEYHMIVPNHLKYRHDIYDPDYILAMQAIIADNGFPNAPQSMNLLFRMCLQHNIPTCFNDAARINYKFIDKNDPLLNYDSPIFKNLNKSNKDDLPLGVINIVSKAGIAIRNSVMAVRALLEAKRIGAKTIIQGTGATHAQGNKSKKSRPYETSLVPAFYTAGAHRVLTVFLSFYDYKAEKIIYEKALEENSNQIIIDGMQNDAYRKHQTREELENINLRAKKWNGNASTFIPTDQPLSKNEVTELMEEAFEI